MEPFSVPFKSSLDSNEPALGTSDRRKSFNSRSSSRSSSRSRLDGLAIAAATPPCPSPPRTHRGRSHSAALAGSWPGQCPPRLQPPSHLATDPIVHGAQKSVPGDQHQWRSTSMAINIRSTSTDEGQHDPSATGSADRLCQEQRWDHRNGQPIGKESATSQFTPIPRSPIALRHSVKDERRTSLGLIKYAERLISTHSPSDHPQRST
jgi:hypothetical protein